MPNNNAHMILLAFDFGMKKIGVAVGQRLTQTASPIAIIPARDGIPSWDQVKRLIDEWQVDGLVVGIPYNMDGSEQEITFAAKKFGERLNKRFSLPVYFTDERLTTVEARSELRHHPGNVDSYAAKLILESWFRDYDAKKS